MTEKPAEPEHWVRMRIPPRFKLGAQGIADRCGWMLRTTDQPEFYNVALRENYERRAPRALRAQKAVTAGPAGGASRFVGFFPAGADHELRPDAPPRGRGLAPRRSARRTRGSRVSAVNLSHQRGP